MCHCIAKYMYLIIMPLLWWWLVTLWAKKALSGCVFKIPLGVVDFTKVCPTHPVHVWLSFGWGGGFGTGWTRLLLIVLVQLKSRWDLQIVHTQDGGTCSALAHSTFPDSQESEAGSCLRLLASLGHNCGSYIAPCLFVNVFMKWTIGSLN